jgi:hypothetical protein
MNDAMCSACLLVIAFAVSLVYAVLGNGLVYVLLARRGVAMRSMWVGTPGYLYRLCVGAEPPVRAWLKWFALSTNIVFVVAMVLGIGLAGFHRE